MNSRVPELTLWLCDRCKLLWANDSIPESCPSCLRRSRIPTKILVAGRDVTEFVIRDYGKREGLLDPEVRRGLDRLRLGHCPHGWITSEICTECNRI